MSKVVKKKEKKYNIITGLPRSGSTLLANILNQNPRFHASETSALPLILSEVKSGWENILENRTVNRFQTKINVLNSIVDGYYRHIDKEVIFDKSRHWMIESHMANNTLGDGTKFIICVRNLTDIIASFENLYRINNAIWDTIDKSNFRESFNTIEGRCKLITSLSGPLGSSLMMLKELIIMNPLENIYFLEYDNLVKYKEGELKLLYEFLNEDYFNHDFDNVKQTTVEDDRIHGILGLHNIRSKVEYIKRNPENIIGPELFKLYSGNEFWRDNK
jgi:sulfotransferase